MTVYVLCKKCRRKIVLKANSDRKFDFSWRLSLSNLASMFSFIFLSACELHNIKPSIFQSKIK